MLIKDISKRQKSLHHSAKLSKEVKEVNEYHLKEKNIYIDPDEREPLPKENSTESSITSSNNLSKPTQRTNPHYNYTLSALRNILPPFTYMAPKTASSTTSRSKTWSTSTNLKYSPDFKNLSTESFLNAISHNKDNALVIVLRLPELMLRELSKVVTYGLQQNEKEAKSGLGQNVGLDIPPGRMSGSRKEKKDMEESLPTNIPYHMTTESVLLPTAFAKNLTAVNSSDNASYSNRKNIDKDKSNNYSESSYDVQISTPTYTTMPVKKDSPYLFNNHSDFIESLMKEAASFQDLSNDSTGRNKISQTVGYQTDPMISTTTTYPDGRQQRKAQTYDAEIKVFKDLMAELIKKFTTRIKSHPNFNAQQKEKAVAYMKSVLPTVVSKHMEELVKEIHRKVEVEGRSERDTRSLPNKYVLNIPSEHEPFYL